MVPLALPFDEGDVCLNYDEDALVGGEYVCPNQPLGPHGTGMERKISHSLRR